MISKLESAGLGFYVRMNETLDKLGQLSSTHVYIIVLYMCSLDGTSLSFSTGM